MISVHERYLSKVDIRVLSREILVTVKTTIFADFV